MDEAGPSAFPDLLRDWRQRRRFSQLELSTISGVSTRHLSFLETGRSRPSRDMVLTLAEHLQVPLRERNVLLTAAGFAPAFGHRPLDAPEMTAVRTAVDQVLAGHEPYPAVAVDRAWNVLSMNTAGLVLIDGVADWLLESPNAYRIGLHPEGLAPRVIDFPVFAGHLLARLRHDVAVTGDPGAAALLEEVEAYPTVRELSHQGAAADAVVVPVRLRHPQGELAMFTTVTTFGTPADVTVAELAIESFFPHDEETARRLREIAEGVAAHA